MSLSAAHLQGAPGLLVSTPQALSLPTSFLLLTVQRLPWPLGKSPNSFHSPGAFVLTPRPSFCTVLLCAPLPHVCKLLCLKSRPLGLNSVSFWVSLSHIPLFYFCNST